MTTRSGAERGAGAATIDRAAPLDALRARCEEAGLDVVHPFDVAWFNDDVEPAWRLPDWGRATALGIVIGNTLRLWPAFTRALEDDALSEEEHPLDTYVERTLSAAAREAIAEPFEIFWAHRATSPAIPIQRIAHMSGLAHLSPSRLSVHAEYGPWFALRAVIVIDVDGPKGERLVPRDPCTRCSKPCVPAFERALAASGSAHFGDVERQWISWANVREVCPEGKAFRYGDDQLRYHYTKDRSILRGFRR